MKLLWIEFAFWCRWLLGDGISITPSYQWTNEELLIFKFNYLFYKIKLHISENTASRTYRNTNIIANKSLFNWSRNPVSVGWLGYDAIAWPAQLIAHTVCDLTSLDPQILW